MKRITAGLGSLFWLTFLAVVICGLIDFIAPKSLEVAMPIAFVYGVGMPLLLFLFDGELKEQIIYYAVFCLIFTVFSCMSLLNGVFEYKNEIFVFAGRELLFDSVCCLVISTVWLLSLFKRNHG